MITAIFWVGGVYTARVILFWGGGGPTVRIVEECWAEFKRFPVWAGAHIQFLGWSE